MADILTAPNKFEGRLPDRTLFLAGGISGCPAWQPIVIEKLIDIPQLLIINPRRDAFDIEDSSMAREQIEWEHYYLRRSGMIMFWFSEGSVNPITLFEYGKYGRLGIADHTRFHNIFVGTHPNYTRNFDVKVQTELYGGPTVYESLDQIVDAVKLHLKYS